MTVRLATTLSNIEKAVSNEENVQTILQFFDFINLNGTIQEKCSAFVKAATGQPSWALNSVIKYLQMNYISSD